MVRQELDKPLADAPGGAKDGYGNPLVSGVVEHGTLLDGHHASGRFVKASADPTRTAG
jgi:hypothetical protein